MTEIQIPSIRIDAFLHIVRQEIYNNARCLSLQFRV